MTDSWIWTIPFLVVAGLALFALHLALRKLERERRRAEIAEARASSYLSILEAASGARGAEEEAGARRATKPDSGAESERARPRAAHPSPVPDPRFLFVSFEEEIRRARKRNQPLTVLTTDLGGLPDGTGGDRLLRRVAHLLRSQMRGCDSCIRYASDEFILVLPGIAKTAAHRMEGRLRLALQAVSYSPAPGKTARVRFSFGSATFPDEASSFEQLLAVADSRRRQAASSAPAAETSAGRRMPSFPLLSKAPGRN